MNFVYGLLSGYIVMKGVSVVRAWYIRYSGDHERLPGEPHWDQFWNVIENSGISRDPMTSLPFSTDASFILKNRKARGATDDR